MSFAPVRTARPAATELDRHSTGWSAFGRVVTRASEVPRGGTHTPRRRLFRSAPARRLWTALDHLRDVPRTRCTADHIGPEFGRSGHAYLQVTGGCDDPTGAAASPLPDVLGNDPDDVLAHSSRKHRLPAPERQDPRRARLPADRAHLRPLGPGALGRPLQRRRLPPSPPAGVLRRA